MQQEGRLIWQPNATQKWRDLSKALKFVSAFSVPATIASGGADVGPRVLCGDDVWPGEEQGLGGLRGWLAGLEVRGQLAKVREQ